MQFDLRIPLGLMFGVFGVILVAVGSFGSPDNTAKSLGINMNLDWGLVLLAFSALMLWFAFAGRKNSGTAKKVEEAAAGRKG